MDTRTGNIRDMEALRKLFEKNPDEEKHWVPVTRETLDQIPKQFRAKALAAIEKREQRAAKRKDQSNA